MALKPRCAKADCGPDFALALNMKSKRSPKSVAAPKAPPVVARPARTRAPRVRKPATANASGETVGLVVSTEVIACRAYEIFVARGFEHGRDLEHWLAAERELLQAL